MARYKVLHSVAHNFGQSFVGSSKAREDDHLMGRLLADCRRTRQPTVTLDIFTGRASPEALVGRSLARVFDRHVREFPELVAGSHTDMKYVKGARMELSFDLAAERPSAAAPGRAETPFVCRVSIDDDRGKTWVAELHGWCVPEERSELLRRLVGQ